MADRVFRSFFLGGFECSTHRHRSGRRLDLIRATAHDTWAAKDYAALQAHGIRTCRDGLRWHLIETTPGRHDFSSALPMLRAASVKPLRKKPGRTEYQRGIVSRQADGSWQVAITGSQGSGILRSMSEANGLVVLGHDQGSVAAGEWVDVLPFDGLL